MDLVTVSLILGGIVLAHKGAQMATKKPAVKKTAKKAEPTVVVQAGLVKTDFGTFQVGTAGDITQLAPYPKTVDAIAGLTADAVADKIRTQAGA